jgi:hypothetical protein
MNVFKGQSKTIILLMLFGLGVTLSTFVFAQTSGSERASNKNEKILLDKIKSGTPLSSAEINKLCGIYLLKKRFSDGIAVLERLGNDNKYKNEEYLIDLNLAMFYLKQASENKTTINNSHLINKSKYYFSLGVNSAREKTAALYARSQIYAYVGCIEKAKSDLQEARKIVHGKGLLEDGIYLNKDKFISLIQSDFDRLNKLKDMCELN